MTTEELKRKEYHREYSKKRYLEKREELLAYQKDYYNKKKEKIKEYKSEWFQENKNSIKLKQKEYNKDRSISHVLYGIKQRCKRKGLEFNLEPEDIEPPEYCPVFGFKLERNLGNYGGQYNSPSVDRIVPELGYVKGNIQVISRLANTMKSNATKEQLESFAKWILKEEK